MGAKWITAEGLRVDGPNGVAVEGLTFGSDGPHLAIIGGSSVLGAALAGAAPLARGTLSIDGKPARDAMLAAEVAHAPIDPRVPEAWTARDFATWSARLGGMDRASARASSTRALAKLALADLADAKLSTLALPARRAVSIAAALATGASTIVFDDPTPGLPDDASRALGRIVAAALDDVRWVWLAGRIALASPLGVRTDDALLLGAGGVLAQGSPAEIASRERVYSLRVSGPSTALAELARARGAVASTRDRELTVELTAEMTTHDLFAMAAEASVTIVSLTPVGRGVA